MSSLYGYEGIPDSSGDKSKQQKQTNNKKIPPKNKQMKNKAKTRKGKVTVVLLHSCSRGAHLPTAEGLCPCPQTPTPAPRGGVTWLMVTLEWGTFVGKEACGCVVEFHSVQEVLGIQIWPQI